MQFSKQVHDYSASASLVMAGTDTQKRMEANIALYEENIRGLSQLEGLAREIDALFADLYGERTGPGAADRIARSVSEFREMRADEQKLLEFERNSRTVELSFGSSQNAEPDFLAKSVSAGREPAESSSLAESQETGPRIYSKKHDEVRFDSCTFVDNDAYDQDKKDITVWFAYQITERGPVDADLNFVGPTDKTAAFYRTAGGFIDWDDPAYFKRDCVNKGNRVILEKAREMRSQGYDLFFRRDFKPLEARL